MNRVLIPKLIILRIAKAVCQRVEQMYVLDFVNSEVLLLLPVRIKQFSGYCVFQIINLICDLFYVSEERSESIFIQHVGNFSCQGFLLNQLDQKLAVSFVQHMSREMVKELGALLKSDILNELV
jgi:hypothetical protein